MVRADRQFLHQILVNLLSNAFKYTPGGTTITISAEPYVPAPENGTRETAPKVLVCVQDAGPGIPPEDIPLLFGKFVRLKRDMVGSVRGTGLGLYICKQMVENMGGRIWVESTGIPGEGSRFCFTLDAPIPSQANESDAPPAVQASSADEAQEPPVAQPAGTEVARESAITQSSSVESR
jgi:signal transduction histidine kinase